MTLPNHEIGSDIPPRAAEVEPPAALFVHAGGSATNTSMGVTGNAIILLGYLAGAVDRLGEDARYRFVAGGAGGEAIVQHRDNGNTYRVSVVQLEGIE